MAAAFDADSMSAKNPMSPFCASPPSTRWVLVSPSRLPDNHRQSIPRLITPVRLVVSESANIGSDIVVLFCLETQMHFSRGHWTRIQRAEIGVPDCPNGASYALHLPITDG